MKIVLDLTKEEATMVATALRIVSEETDRIEVFETLDKTVKEIKRQANWIETWE